MAILYHATTRDLEIGQVLVEFAEHKPPLVITPFDQQPHPFALAGLLVHNLELDVVTFAVAAHFKTSFFTRAGIHPDGSAAASSSRFADTADRDPELQLSDLRDYAEARGWQIMGEFVDLGVSGSKDTRPQLDAMMRQAKTRKLDVIAVWKLDRFGRSLRHLVDALAELEATGVAFVSLRDNLDLSTPAGKLMFHVIGAMAEFERALIQERVRAGLAVARSKGKTLGRPKLRRDHDKDAKRIRQLRDEGQSYRDIADELGRSTMDVHRVAMTLGCAAGGRDVGVEACAYAKQLTV